MRLPLALFIRLGASCASIVGVLSIVLIAQAPQNPTPAMPPAPMPRPAQPPVTNPAAVPASQRQIKFTDLSESAGIRFTHVNGAGGEHFYPEQMGGGVVLFDYDNDGLLDIYLVQGGAMPGFKGADPTGAAFYRNMGNNHFIEMTRQAGLASTKYGFGVAAADYDNDGFQDLYVTNLDGNILYHNNGNGRFIDVTDKAGVRVPAMSTSPAFIDYDADGLVDLFVARYMDWSLQTDKRCGFIAANGTQPFGAHPRSVPVQPGSPSSYCGPQMYPGTNQRLFRNQGDGTFADVSAKSGIGKPIAHGMATAIADFNNDGLIDIFLSSDTTPNLLFLNTPGSVFREEGMLAGVAVPQLGTPRAGMGIDVADYDNDGRMDAFITNYEAEPSSLFHNHGDGTFTEDSMRSAVQAYSLKYMKWGTRFVDFNLDGRADLFVVNGHLDERAGTQQQGGPTRTPPPPGTTVITQREGYKQQAQIYVSDGPNHFADASDLAGPFFQTKHTGRGAAFGDIDNDGDIDVVITSINDAPSILRNDTPRTDRWAQLELQGAGCNRDALGTRVVVKAGVVTQTQFVRSGGSYLSDHDRRLVFGLPGFGTATAEIHWPCGSTQIVELTPGKTMKVTEAACKLPPRKK